MCSPPAAPPPSREPSGAGRRRLPALHARLRRAVASRFLAPELLFVRPLAPCRHGEASAECCLSDGLHQLRLQSDGAQLHHAAGCRLVGPMPPLRKLRSPRATLGGRIGAPFAPI